MSRNKDRYESSNNRRQQVFMSQEDVAAGRKSNWTGVEITGNPSIGQLNAIIIRCLFLNFERSVCFLSQSQAMCAILAQFYGNLNI